MNIDKIKKLVKENKKVFWMNKKSQVIADNNDFFVNIYDEELIPLEILYQEDDNKFYCLNF